MLSRHGYLGIEAEVARRVFDGIGAASDTDPSV